MINEETTETVSRDEVLRMSVDVVAAFLSNNQLASGQIPEVIDTVFRSLYALDGTMAEAKPEPQKPAVPIRRSVTSDFIICLEDGKKLKMLKRHLRTNYNLTPEEYRAKWNLSPDYPMVAPSYAKQRSEFAKKIGLGRKPGEKTGKRK
ncbi:MAG: transcriptional regulator [Rhodospirillales bacterium]|jgi:predicted transcriptional regulator|nr:transcriptional regulator [Rhodospirillales bacterium]